MDRLHRSFTTSASTSTARAPPPQPLDLQYYHEDPMSFGWDEGVSPVKIVADTPVTFPTAAAPSASRSSADNDNNNTNTNNTINLPPHQQEQRTPTPPPSSAITTQQHVAAEMEEPLPADVSDAASAVTYERDASPPPTLSPTLALDAVPQLDRSVSTASSSMSSRRSSSSRLSDPGGLSSAKRRGYMRPQVTNYSESAKNRESVMSLGSIAHLQYYFARTGLLDGKGAQVARPEMLKRKSSNNLRGDAAGSRAVSMSGAPETPTAIDAHSGLLSPTMAAANDSCAVSDAGFTDSPIEQDGEVDWESEMMLPPTVSTYNQKPIYVPPPPDLTMLRRELTEALEDALKVLKETDRAKSDESPGWYEIQGLHLLDIITLAIRAARNYYTAHTRPQRLYAFRSEKDIRNDLYKTLEILKRMAGRNFAGGIRQGEKVEILTWIVGISELIQSEIDQEKREQEEQGRMRWRVGGDDEWKDRKREREELFLRSFMDAPDEMPAWANPTDAGDANLPTPFLRYFHDGLRLVTLHNELVRKSRRQFEEIKSWHQDTGKPYRRAENLRYWIKAAQLRWDVKLSLDVMAVVQGVDPAAWREFDEAILKWARGVREEIVGEWEGKVSPTRRAPPALRIEPQTPERVGRPELEVKSTAELGTVA